MHFIFNPGQPTKVSPFTRKFVKLMEGPEALVEFERQEAEAYDAYIDAITKEEEDATDPIVYGANPFYELELKSLQRLSFAVADNPFMKTEQAKYYPEIHVILENGTVFSTIGPSNRSDKNFSNSMFVENFRDDRLKINDDRKVKLTLSDFKNRRNLMVLLTVRVYESKGPAAAANAFKQAWYRLQNEDTNQSLDYSYIDKVKAQAGIEDAEEEQADEDEEDEDGAPKAKNEMIFLAGRLYREDTEVKTKGGERQSEEQPPASSDKPANDEDPKFKTRWIYERWNKVINTSEF